MDFMDNTTNMNTESWSAPMWIQFHKTFLESQQQNGVSIQLVLCRPSLSNWLKTLFSSALVFGCWDKSVSAHPGHLDFAVWSHFMCFSPVVFLHFKTNLRLFKFFRNAVFAAMLRECLVDYKTRRGWIQNDCNTVGGRRTRGRGGRRGKGRRRRQRKGRRRKRKMKKTTEKEEEEEDFVVFLDLCLFI